MSELCQQPGCNNPVSKEGHTKCLDCWKKSRSPKRKSSSSGEGELNSSKIAEHFGIKAQRLNAILKELGWVERATKGWKPTDAGVEMKASQTEYRPTGVPFVKWPKSILENRILQEAVSDYKGNSSSSASPSMSDFRQKFPANLRTMDGHMVRSRAEVLIDNYLYNAGLVHAYERKLPVEEDVYSDFYLPDKRIYIEYWGLENEPKYAARKETKQAIYSKYKDRFHLIELGNDEIANLDDHLPRLLLKFGIAVD